MDKHLIDRPQRWILLRGLMRSQYHWLDFPTRLANHLQIPTDAVVTVELTGNGHFSHRETPSTVTTAIQQLRQQVPFLQAPQSEGHRYGLIGISLGGMLATAWAQQHPDEVKSLVLINSSSPLSPFYRRLRPANYPLLLRQMIRQLFSDSDFKAFEHFVLSRTSNRPEHWRPLLNKFAEFQRQHPATFKNFIRQLNLASQVDFKKMPQCPKLILAARQDRFVHHSCSEKIAHTWNCNIHYHDSAGHDLPLDDGEWILLCLSEFLSEL